jgi:hypothetical protein
VRIAIRGERARALHGVQQERVDDRLRLLGGRAADPGVAERARVGDEADEVERPRERLESLAAASPRLTKKLRICCLHSIILLLRFHHFFK